MLATPKQEVGKGRNGTRKHQDMSTVAFKGVYGTFLRELSVQQGLSLAGLVKVAVNEFNDRLLAAEAVKQAPAKK